MAVENLAPYVEHPWTAFTAACLIMLACICLWAMIVKSWRDTLLECVALAAIVFFAVSRAYYAVGIGAIPWDMVGLSLAITAYSLVKVHQHYSGLYHKRRRETDLARWGRPQRRKADSTETPEAPLDLEYPASPKERQHERPD